MEIDVKAEMERVNQELAELTQQLAIINQQLNNWKSQQQEAINQIARKSGELELLKRLEGKKE